MPWCTPKHERSKAEKRGAQRAEPSRAREGLPTPPRGREGPRARDGHRGQPKLGTYTRNQPNHQQGRKLCEPKGGTPQGRPTQPKRGGRGSESNLRKCKTQKECEERGKRRRGREEKANRKRKRGTRQCLRVEVSYVLAVRYRQRTAKPTYLQTTGQRVHTPLTGRRVCPRQ